MHHPVEIEVGRGGAEARDRAEREGAELAEVRQREQPEAEHAMEQGLKQET